MPGVITLDFFSSTECKTHESLEKTAARFISPAHGNRLSRSRGYLQQGVNLLENLVVSEVLKLNGLAGADR